MRERTGALPRRLACFAYWTAWKTWQGCKDGAAMLRFIVAGRTPAHVTWRTRYWLMVRWVQISRRVPCLHRERQVLVAAEAILDPDTPSGVVVECGAYLGGGTAKLSLACHLAGRHLVTFEGFKGLPSSEGRFAQGDYRAPRAAWEHNVTKWGARYVVHVHEGWFEDTMPRHMPERVAVAYVDVDVAASARTAMRHVWRAMPPGGLVISQDGCYAAVVGAMDKEAGAAIRGLRGEGKIRTWRKPSRLIAHLLRDGGRAQ